MPWRFATSTAFPGELYFEEEDIEGFCGRLASIDVRYVHPLFEHRWGQRVVRFYDPDGHVIEVGERLDVVVRRFFEGGLSAAETAERMDIPIGMVLSCLGDGALRLVKANVDDFIRVRDDDVAMMTITLLLFCFHSCVSPDTITISY